LKKEVETILIKTYFLMSLVPSYSKLNEEQKFVAKVEFLNVMRRIKFCEPPYHVSSPPQLQYYFNLPGPSAHTSYIGTLPNVTVPSGQHHKVSTDLQHHIHTIRPFKILIPNSRLVHSTLLQPTAVPPCTYVALGWKLSVTFNTFLTV
jgi:hypothetical protein